jgi:hypothetical protein
VVIAHSGNFEAANPLDNLFDGCVDQLPSWSAGNDGIASFWLIMDLGAPHALTRARLFGDAAGAWLSRSWSVKTSCLPEGPWTDAFVQRPALGTQWFEEPLNVGGCYVRV